MQSISTIGLDIAKSVFQVHGVDAGGQVVIRRQLRRRHVLAFFKCLNGRSFWINKAPSQCLTRGNPASDSERHETENPSKGAAGCATARTGCAVVQDRRARLGAASRSGRSAL